MSAAKDIILDVGLFKLALLASTKIASCSAVTMLRTASAVLLDSLNVVIKGILLISCCQLLRLGFRCLLCHCAIIGNGITEEIRSFLDILMCTNTHLSVIIVQFIQINLRHMSCKWIVQE